MPKCPESNYSPPPKKKNWLLPNSRCLAMCMCTCTTVSTLCACGRMASRICDTEGCGSSKVIHTVPRLYCESTPADFASVYMAKSGTPLLYRKDVTPYRDPNVLAVCTPSPLVHRDMIWPGDSSCGDVTCLNEDPTQSVFCNRFNVQSCLRYLNQVNLNSYLSICDY